MRRQGESRETRHRRVSRSLRARVMARRQLTDSNPPFLLCALDLLTCSTYDITENYDNSAMFWFCFRIRFHCAHFQTFVFPSGTHILTSFWFSAKTDGSLYLPHIVTESRSHVCAGSVLTNLGEVLNPFVTSVRTKISRSACVFAALRKKPGLDSSHFRGAR